MGYEIRPEPDDTEREAILLALAADELVEDPVSRWVQAVLPERGGEAGEP